ncbi:hypothetical protein [Mesorhizobium sp. IMUNJ 23232]|uniref:hypothetical protein n=1 Tax=Mesorhizobium sp. IMUNJ 23232 TaxID=3376064 RepID=UPI0037B9AA9A
MDEVGMNSMEAVLVGNPATVGTEQYPETVPTAKPHRKMSSVSVRVVEERDWPAIRELVRKQHRRTVFSDMPFSDKKFDAIEARLKKSAKHECLIVAEAKSEIVGGAWFAAGEYALCENSLMTTVHIIAVDAERCGPYLSARTFIRLVRGVVVWSESVKAKRVLVHVTTGVNLAPTDRLMKAVGSDIIGGGYVIKT